jgi:gluconokinase
MEGIAYRIQLIYRLLAEGLPGDPQIIGSGGALLHSPLWMQILADVLGRPVTKTASLEASARGAALLALEALHLIDDVDKAERNSGQVAVPDARRHRLYEAAAQRQEQLYFDVITPRQG